MKINQLKGGVMLSYGTQLVHILTGLLYTPVMLRLLGQSEYGLYQLVFSVVSYLSMLSLGFGSSYMRFYSRYKAKGDEDNVAKLNGMFLIIFTVISVICVLCGTVMLANVKAIFGNGLTPSELSTARILLALMVINIAASFINSVFTNNITAHEKFIFQRVVELLKAIFNPFLTLPLLIMGYGSVAMVSVTTFLTFFVLFLNISYCVKKIKIRFSFKQLDFSLLKEMWIFTSFIFIGIITDQINWSIDKFLLGRMIGTVVVAVYGVAGQLNSLYLSLSSSVSSVFIPRVNMLIAKKEDNKALTTLFARVGRIQFLILGLIISGYIVFGKEFIAIWAGQGYDDSYIIGLFLMIPVTVPLIQNLGIEIQRAKNLHKMRAIVYLLVAISNIFVSILCIQRWGTKGAAVGTAISLIAGNIIFMNIYYHKKVKLDIIYFWKEILKIMPAVVLASLIGFLIKNYVNIDGIIGLSINIIAYAAVYIILIWTIGMNKSEKALISGPIKKILKR